MNCRTFSPNPRTLGKSHHHHHHYHYHQSHPEVSPWDKGPLHRSKRPSGEAISGRNVPHLILEPRSEASSIPWRCPLRSTNTSSTWNPTPHPPPPPTPTHTHIHRSFFIVCVVGILYSLLTGEHGKMEETGSEIICGAPTTVLVKG